MELIKSYRGYTITIDGAKISAVNGTDFIIFTADKIKNKSINKINNLIYKTINKRLRYLLNQ